jgi:hypothetical protein
MKKNNGFPSQKKSSKEKTKEWRESHFSWAKNAILSEKNSVQASIRRKERNVLSYLGKVRIEEYASLLNPNSLKKFAMPKEIPHHPIASPYLNVLIGEEFDRRFEFKAVLTNPNAISQKEKEKQAIIAEKVKELLFNPEIQPDQAAAELEKTMKDLDSYQDLREKKCNIVLKHYIKELDLKMKFNSGFKDVLLNSEEAYIGDVFNNHPSIEKMDQAKTFVIRSGSSNRYEDADVIITYDYLPPGLIQDRYYRFLSEKDVEWLDDTSSKYIQGDTDLERDEIAVNILRRGMMDDMISMPETMGSSFSKGHSEVVDEFGNVRVIRLFWKSKKKIRRIKKYDQITGKPVYDYMSEDYVLNKSMGEEAEDYFVSEWWEGVEVGDGIYPYIKPRDIQFNRLDDPGYNHPGIVGHIYSINSYKASSLMDMAFPYQLMYDATFWRMQDAMTKFFGSLVVVDLASLPTGWDISKWMFFAKKAGISVKDSFKEGNKGASTGKLSGGLPNQGQSINQQLGDFIQQQVNILNYVEQQMGRIIGVPPQRLGDIQNRETVGGVERAVTQSSYITNERFKIHDNVKKRVLTMLIELCRVAFKNSKKKFQFISDDYSNLTVEIDEGFAEENYGILVDNDVDVSKLEASLERITEMAINSQMIRYSDVFKIYNSSSISEKQRIIEKGEQAMMEQAQATQAQEQQQIAEQNKMMQDQFMASQATLEKHHNDKMLFDKYKVDLENETKRMIAAAGDNTDGVMLEFEKLSQESNKFSMTLEKEYEELRTKSLQDMKELSEKIRNNKATEQIASKQASNKSVSSGKK